MILGNRQICRSTMPSQSFIWVADYYDNTSLLEFDPKTKQFNNFYTIDKNKLIALGLIGEGSQVYFDVANGIFNINGHRIMISYVTKTKEYPLTGRTILYNDVITYKKVDADADMFKKSDRGDRFNQTITSFNVGYKKKMELEGVNISFQNILTIPFDESLYLQIKISADQDLDGEMIIRRDGLIVDSIHAPLKKDMAGIINWNIK
ncbi:MAG: hypothetical protein ACQEXX_02010 [Bacillota bacterium]